MTNVKPLVASKTAWASVLMAVLPFIPGPTGEWIRGNPEAAVSLASLIFGGLRFYTDQAISLKKLF